MPPTHTAKAEPGPPYGDLPLTEHLRHWAAVRGHQRAFSFVEFPELGSPGLHRTVTWQRLYARARALGDRLSATVNPGDRAALLLPQGLDYVTAFLGCLYARVIAVPLFSPELPGHANRLRAVLEDCEPACVLTDSATAAAVADFAAAYGTAGAPVLCVDRPDAPPLLTGSAELPPDPGDIAYLQYTSGSTRLPAGVMISHRNAVANARQAITAFDADTEPTTTVGWLPLFHDMGLVLSVAAPVVGGFPSVLMDPVSFLERPLRWLRLLGAYPGTVSAAPNFAYDYCAARTSAQELAELRLDRVRGLINGSEPVRPGTVDRFQRALSGSGLPPQAQCPSYGLAEATVFVANDPCTQAPTTVDCDRAALEAGRVVVAAEGATATRLVACGGPVGQELRIVDPATGVPRPDGEVGEIWLRGPNTGLGYWKQAERTEATFGGRLPGDAESDGRWLRTGDLGARHQGQLLVTGRLKDLVIVDGRNHYPQDVEETIQSAVDAVRRDRIALFTVPAPASGPGHGSGPDSASGAGLGSVPGSASGPGAGAAPGPGAGAAPGSGSDHGPGSASGHASGSGSGSDSGPGIAPDSASASLGGEELVVAVAEHRRGFEPTAADRADADRTARAAVSAGHGLRLARLLLVPPGEVPRTSSGKVARSACRDLYLAGGFTDGSAGGAGRGFPGGSDGSPGGGSAAGGTDRPADGGGQ